MARTFVAAWPPPEALDLLCGLPRPAEPGVRWVQRHALHVTLRFLGDVMPTSVTRRLLSSDLPRATAQVGPRTAVLGANVVMAPVAGLDALASAVARATAGIGQPPPRRPFVGHVTLARTRDAATARRLGGAPVTGSFEVRELAVVTSETHPDGARYRTSAVVPLG